jgi:hypothetical protein
LNRFDLENAEIAEAQRGAASAAMANGKGQIPNLSSANREDVCKLRRFF